MQFIVVVESNKYTIEVSEEALSRGDSFFQKMDSDMDKGWQMSREWVANPDQLQRCQIVADKLADAIENSNQTLADLTGAYILTHMPGVKEVHIDTEGEMQETRFV